MPYSYFNAPKPSIQFEYTSEEPVQHDNPFAPNYKHVSKNYYPPEFYKIRPKIIARFSNRCFLCGELAENIHHIDYNVMNNDKNNLMLLCTRCHSKTNFSRDYWETTLKEKMCIVFHCKYD
jgi:5-methylcytosine-specific restriction endonuclease McrA